MRYRNKGTMLAFLASAVVLGACGNTTASTNVEETLGNAIQKNAEIENGRFESIITMKAGSEKIDRLSEGAFIKVGAGEYDWYWKKPFPAQLDSTQELLELDGKQYHRINKDAWTVSEWIELPDSIASLQEAAIDLFAFRVVNSEVEKSEVVETEAGDTEYRLRLREDAFSERVQSESREDIEKSIEKLRKKDADDIEIKRMENRLEDIEDTAYRDVIYTYKINKEGYLTTVSFEAITDPAEGASYSLLTNYTLTEYNLTDTAGLLPQLHQ